MNPEFQRNLYLEFSFARLVGMPAFLLVIFSLTYSIDDKSFDKVTAYTALGLYIAIVLFWGAKQASESILDELRNNTWDIQRTSAISPWSLAWGKLLGSTLFNWYGGLLCLLVYSIAIPKPEHLILTWVYSLSCGLLAQGLSLLTSLFALRRRLNVNSSFNYLFVLFALFFIITFMINIDKSYDKTLYWYGEPYNVAYFYAISLIIACFWTVIGIYRLLSEEFRIRTLPWVLVFFIAFLVFYLTGLMDRAENILHRNMLTDGILVGFLVCTTMTYVLIFIDNNSPMKARKLWVYTEQEKWLRVLQELPSWLVSLILSLPPMLILALLSNKEVVTEIHLYPVVIFLLMLRDISILLFFSYAPNPKRAMGLTLMYLICLYGLLPAIFKGLDAKTIAEFILPILSENRVSAIIFSLVQTTAIGFLLFQRWQELVMRIKE